MKKQETKVVVITGASSGIGRAIADELSSHNFIVYDISRTVHENKNIKGAYSCNVNDTEKMKSILDEAIDPANNIIMFIDEVHTIIGAGGQDHNDAAQMLKPMLSR